MPFKDIIGFTGGINTSLNPMLIPNNEAVVVTSCDIADGYIVASKKPLSLELTIAGTKSTYYKAKDVIVTSSEDRTYVEWAGFLYWSDTAGTLKRFDGATTLNVGGWSVPSVAPTCVASATPATMLGDYTYCYTYQHNTVFESPPSPFKVLTGVTAINKTGVDISFTDTPPSSATARIVYRLGGIVPTFRFIAEVPIATTTYKDTTSDYQIDPYELVTFGNEPPPLGLDLLTENNGVFFGALNDRVYFSRQGTPEYWSEYNYVELPHKVTALGKSGSSIIAFTDSEMHMISGNDLSNISVSKLPFQYGCSHKHSIGNIDGMLLWVSTVAGRLIICSFDGQQVTIVSEKHKTLDLINYITDHIYDDFNAETYANLVFEVYNTTVFNRKYYLNTNVGTYILDFNNGFRISLLGYTPTEYIVRNTELIASKDGTLYTVNASYSGNLNMVYKTGLIIDGSAAANKSYRRIRIRGEGTFTTTVIIDGKTVLTSDLNSFYLPAEAVGTSIQFLLRSTGYAMVSAISYEYEVLAL